MKIIEIDQQSADQRFDRFLRKYYKHTPEISLGDIFSWIRKGSIKVNKRKAKQDYRLQVWDIITRDDAVSTDKKASQHTRKKDKKVWDLSVERLSNMILYEDENRIFWNKPAHVLIHPGDKHNTDITMHDMMCQYLQLSWQRNATETYSPSFAYRLDKNTSGIVVSAKNYEALKYINQLIRTRQVKKKYTTVLLGECPSHLEISEPIFVWYNRSTWRSQSFINTEKWKDSHTILDLMQTSSDDILGIRSLVDVTLITWRMHQIRVHCAHHKLPVLGDLEYWNPAANRVANKNFQISRQLLHASSYWFFDKFAHKNLKIQSPLPAEFWILFPL